MLFIFSTLLLFSSIKSVFPTTSSNLCSTANLCCRHRDSGCVVQRVLANHSVDTSELPCYCDQACTRLDDCCRDYRDYCQVRDCVVSEFGPWSPCPMPGDLNDPCRSDRAPEVEEAWTERRRVVLHHPVNGGLRCPHLAQRKLCSCDRMAGFDDHDEVKVEGKKDENMQEEERSSFDHEEEVMEEVEDENWGQEGKKPHIHHLTTSSEKQPKSSSSSCSEMVILRSVKSCRRQDHRLHTGTRICVECADPSSCPGVVVDSTSPASSSPYYLHRRDPTGVMRRFTLGRHCRGRAAVIRAGCGEKCGEEGLRFRVVK